MGLTESDIRESTFEGLAASPGVAIGSAVVISHRGVRARAEQIRADQVNEELSTLNAVREGTIRDLKSYEHSDSGRNYGDAAEILEAQIEIVKDPELYHSACRSIEEDHHKADYAVSLAFEQYLHMIEKSGNQRMIERLVDIRALRDRLIRRIQRRRPDLQLTGNALVVSGEISAAEVIEYARSGVKAIVSDKGGLTSHAVIIANSLGVPAVVGTRNAARIITTGDPLIVDGKRGRVILHPGDETLERYKRLLSRIHREEEEIARVIEVPTQTSSGEPFRLRANIEFAEELGNLIRYRAQGIGLLRTETSLLSPSGISGEGPPARPQAGMRETQQQLYQKSLDATGEETVTIRLFDIGGDKFLEGDSGNEMNPFLGWRGIRLLLDNRRLLDTQLEAILEMAGRAPGRVRILVPMVSTIEEIQKIRQAVTIIQNKLADEQKPVDPNVMIGIMLEVPSMVLLADRIAEYVDFFSIGTNDLTQYTLAVDRGNTRISHLYQQMHPALWTLVHIAAQAAHKYDKDITVCGELAGKPFAASCLVGMGIMDLSMAPAAIPAVKKVLVHQSLSSMQELAGRVLEAVTVADIHEIMKNWEAAMKDQLNSKLQ